MSITLFTKFCRRDVFTDPTTDPSTSIIYLFSKLSSWVHSTDIRSWSLRPGSESGSQILNSSQIVSALKTGVTQSSYFQN